MSVGVRNSEPEEISGFTVIFHVKLGPRNYLTVSVVTDGSQTSSE